MPRTILPGLLHEVTLKTFQARFLLAPDGRLNDLVVGVLARAQRLFGLTVCAVVVLSRSGRQRWLTPLGGRKRRRTAG